MGFKTIWLCGVLFFSFTVSNASAANWEFENVMAGKSRCEFKLPLRFYVRSTQSLEKISLEKSGCAHSLNISEAIKIEDKDRLESLVSFYRSNPEIDPPVTIHLDSVGGSVSASLAIAREIRDPQSPLYGIHTFVGENDRCLSSCVFILAAGFRRSVAGEVGVHRPRFIPGDIANMGYEDLQSAYNGIYDQLSFFFRKTNIHPNFIDAMWQVPSSDIRYLSESELSFYRLEGTDLVAQEQKILELIQACGDSGPSLERDFLGVIESQCTSANGKVNSECFSKVLDTHPYGDCLELSSGG